MARCYPISLNIKDKLCLVVGGGAVAERKVHSLLECGARVRVVSPGLADGLADLAESGDIEYRPGEYTVEDLEGVFLVIAATDGEQVNRRVAADCFERNLLVNAVDDPPNGNFFVPAVVRRESLQVAVSTDGKSPLLARRIREYLDTVFSPGFGPMVEFLGDIRENIISNIDDDTSKKTILAGLIDRQAMRLMLEGQFDLAKERISNAYHSSRSQS